MLVIDMINDFVSGALGGERALRIIAPLRELLRRAREVRIPVIYVSDAHLPGIDREFELWPSHALEGSWGAEIIEELRPEAGDYNLKKRRYSAFYATGLDPLLRELGVDTVILTGLVTNICIQHTAADAFFRGYRVVIPRDCVEASTQDEQEAALRYMERIYGAKLVSSEELVRALT
ncbi:MAG: isochorismatase family cysteine hydrolase [Candidatus Bathyarchaeia archaeon]